MLNTTFTPSIEKLQDKIKKFERRLQNQAVRSGLVYAVSPIKKAAKQLAPKDSGNLSKAIGHRQLSKRAKARLGEAPSTTALLVGANRKIKGRWQGRKGMWQEFGTDKMQANPFLEPALSQNESQLISRFYQGLRRFLDRKQL